MRTLKCMLLGDTGVGKTTFINALLQSDKPRSLEEPVSISYETTYGPVTFEIYEDGASPNMDTPDCILLLFDQTKEETITILASIYGLYQFYCGIETIIPTIVCGNKSDLPEGIEKERIQEIIGSDLIFHSISSLNQTNLRLPFEDLARQCVNSTLEFVESK